MRVVEITVEGLSCHRVPEKLRREGILLLSAKTDKKNALKVRVGAKDSKKVFAILRGSCYNVKKVRPVGLERLKIACIRSVGLFVGAALALFSVCFLQGRILKINVEGSGAYLAPEVRAILSEEGIGYFSAPPRDTSHVSARILSLPRVDFCSLRLEGGVYVVNVEVDDDISALECVPLCAPATGVVEELVVIRGTPLVQIGDEVQHGLEIVGCYTVYGEKNIPCAVIARVRVAFPVSREYALTEEGAKAQALLDFGEITDVTTRQTATGWLIEGTGHAEKALNLG